MTMNSNNPFLYPSVVMIITLIIVPLCLGDKVIGRHGPRLGLPSAELVALLVNVLGIVDGLVVLDGLLHSGPVPKVEGHLVLVDAPQSRDGEVVGGHEFGRVIPPTEGVSLILNLLGVDNHLV